MPVDRTQSSGQFKTNRSPDSDPRRRSDDKNNLEEIASVVVIEKRAFFLDCITRSLRSFPELNVISVTSVGECLELTGFANGATVVLCSDGKLSSEETKRDLDALLKTSVTPQIVIISDFDGVEEIIDALTAGARGFIPANTSLGVVVEAIKVVRAGGTFVPASCLLAARKFVDGEKGRQEPYQQMFTARQALVVDALRLGKANKTIAYELNMCESTVKVHVRNIMKRLKARNRTQVAYLAGELLAKAGK